MEDLLNGPLTPEHKEPVLAKLSVLPSADPVAVSYIARTLVRRLDVGAGCAVSDLALWVEAPRPLRELRIRPGFSCRRHVAAISRQRGPRRLRGESSLGSQDFANYLDRLELLR